jgi:restriction endonuclease S subunit
VHIIRVTDVTVISKYISLYLNSAEGQKAISQIVTGGSYIQSILVKNLADLKIPLPSIHVQKTIIALHENIKEQERLRSRKQEIQQTIVNTSFINI